jgi:hypothetical protein
MRPCGDKRTRGPGPDGRRPIQLAAIATELAVTDGPDEARPPAIFSKLELTNSSEEPAGRWLAVLRFLSEPRGG